MRSSIAVGGICPNGAVIVDHKPALNDDAHVVLCLWVLDKQEQIPSIRKADPYVTWKAYVNSEGISTLQGHYFDTLSDAVVDFNNRV